MAFRANEEAQRGFEIAKEYLVHRNIHPDKRAESLDVLHDIVDRYGPVVDSYPSWHPMVSNHNDRQPETYPSPQCGYRGLDHSIYFRNAFITCPYDDGQKVFDSVNKLNQENFAVHNYNVAILNAEKLDAQLYIENATPILVTCEWGRSLSMDGMIPAALAIPLMLEQELSGWRWAECGETWESMRRYFLGAPHGARSSLFVNQDTAQTMKKIWNLLINTGMYGVY